MQLIIPSRFPHAGVKTSARCPVQISVFGRQLERRRAHGLARSRSHTVTNAFQLMKSIRLRNARTPRRCARCRTRSLGDGRQSDGTLCFLPCAGQDFCRRRLPPILPSAAILRVLLAGFTRFELPGLLGGPARPSSAAPGRCRANVAGRAGFPAGDKGKGRYRLHRSARDLSLSTSHCSRPVAVLVQGLATLGRVLEQTLHRGDDVRLWPRMHSKTCRGVEAHFRRKPTQHLLDSTADTTTENWYPRVTIGAPLPTRAVLFRLVCGLRGKQGRSQWR